MPDNNQYRSNPERQGQYGERRQQSAHPSRQYSAQRPRPNRQGSRNDNNRQRRRKKDETAAIGAVVKGIIAIMITLLIVVVVIMLFAKNLFTKNDSDPTQTGVITSTEYEPPKETETVTETEATKKPKKEKSDEEEEEEEEDEDVQTIKCTGAVLLHPDPSSNSATLATIPAGVDVKFIRNENNWYYVEYDGQEGYAWGNYFTAPVTTAE